jgi:hypothetical protein
VGQPIARVPDQTGSVGLRRRPARGESGWTTSVGALYVGGYVANYEDARRTERAYPGYGMVNLGIGYLWQREAQTFEWSLSVRNALGRDLLASHARVGAGREVTWSARMLF